MAMLDLDRGPSPQSIGAGLGIVFYARKFVGLAGWVTAGLDFSGLDQGGFCGTSHGIRNNYSLHPFSWWKAKETEKMEIQEPITPPDISSSLIHYNNSFPSFHSLHASYSSSHLIKVLSFSPLHLLSHLLSYIHEQVVFWV